MTLQAVGKYGADKAKIAENEKTVIDWEHWEAAIDDPVVGEMKAVYEDLMKAAEAKVLPTYEKDQQDLLAKLNEQFEGAVRPASPTAPAPLPHPTAHERASQHPRGPPHPPSRCVPQISEARKAEAASMAGMAQTIADMKALEGSMTVCATPTPDPRLAPWPSPPLATRPELRPAPPLPVSSLAHPRSRAPPFSSLRRHPAPRRPCAARCSGASTRQARPSLLRHRASRSRRSPRCWRRTRRCARRSRRR